ncbi:hypothetical protein KVR01_012856 [Diaporthe batatas]|uniref:uncharacterized protein n=1 Tax=Diaporthe batatas TaxID=748121 RepID=UPI001D03F2FF|nr:uncharacterized protein KVR01_012856 [Diaporthe batatas]KAG8157472.1 hypothetical protein KVR01_012856 [Diaporthe batatas]
MAPGRKLGESCWTCRLRRKRCDAVRPICGSCQALDISCHAGETRPSWMDGGPAQSNMSEAIKRRIKYNALLRRERRLLAAAGHEPLDHDVLDAAVVSTTQTAASLSLASGSDDGFQSQSQSQSPFESRSPSTTGLLSDGAHTLPTISSPAPSSSSSWSAGLGIPIQAPAQAQLASVMIYLDYVFPFLFPFYRPSLLETGRQWLLGMLCQNEVSFHTAASLSSYFFSLVPQDEERQMHDECKALVWERLIGQMDLAVKTIQSSVAVLSHQGVHGGSLTGKARIMQEIAQLLIVEVTVRRDVDWTIHLTPALALFDDIFTAYGLDGASEPSVTNLMNALPPMMFPVPTTHQKPLPNTPDQSALAFFLSLLLYVDIVASTSLGRAPHLHRYHPSLLSSQSEQACQLRIDQVVGCQNWPLVAIGNISALCAWRREVKQTGTFSVFQLVKLADPISQALDDGLLSLERNPPRAAPSGKGPGRRLEGYYSRHDRSIDHNAIATVTRIWAYAAKIYLSVIVSGWQPNSAEVYDNVSKVVGLLQTIESPAQLRSLSWPICVAGCLALPVQEPEFRRIVGEVGELADFGTIGTTLRIMEEVWRSRETADGDACDLASALNVLGSSALLI